MQGNIVFSNFWMNRGTKKTFPSAPVPTRWTSTYEAISYTPEHIQATKAFLNVEKDNHDCEALEETREFLQNHYKMIKAESFFRKNSCQMVC